MCETAPPTNSTKKTLAIGTSRDFVGTPPRAAVVGGYGAWRLRCACRCQSKRSCTTWIGQNKPEVLPSLKDKNSKL